MSLTTMQLVQRVTKLENVRAEYKLKELENKFSVLKGYYDDLLKRVVELEKLNIDYGK